jgi:hypothetical protein
VARQLGEANAPGTRLLIAQVFEANRERINAVLDETLGVIEAALRIPTNGRELAVGVRAADRYPNSTASANVTRRRAVGSDGIANLARTSCSENRRGQSSCCFLSTSFINKPIFMYWSKSIGF